MLPSWFWTAAKWARGTHVSFYPSSSLPAFIHCETVSTSRQERLWFNFVSLARLKMRLSSLTVMMTVTSFIEGYCVPGAFTLRCWRTFLRVPWTEGRSNQSILKEISPECSLGRLMLKLKPQYFGHLTRRTDLFEKTLMLGKIEGRRRGWQHEMAGWHHQLNGHAFEQ